MYRDTSSWVMVHGLVAKKPGKWGPHCWELDDKSNLDTITHAVSIWTRTSKSYITFISEIIPSNLNTCKINEMFNFNAMKANQSIKYNKYWYKTPHVPQMFQVNMSKHLEEFLLSWFTPLTITSHMLLYYKNHTTMWCIQMQ